MRETIRELISEEQVNERIRELGEKISKDYEGKTVHLVCILKGACFFMCELAKRITVPVSMDFMTVSSYGSGTKSSGRISTSSLLRISLTRAAHFTICRMSSKREDAIASAPARCSTSPSAVYAT